MPKKILDLMNVENLTRENVASHLQKFRLYLKRISGVANQQAIMSNSDLHFFQMSSSINGLEGFHHRPIPVGSGQFHGGASAIRPFPSNGILGRLNTPSGIGVRNLSSSGMFLQNPTDLGKFNNSSSLPLDGGNILQGLPIPLEFDKSIASGNSLPFPSFTTQPNSLNGCPNNNNVLVLDGHPQASPSTFPSHQITKRMDHWSNDVSLSTLPPPPAPSSNNIHHQFDVLPLPHSKHNSLEWNNVSGSYNPAMDTNPQAFCRTMDFDSNPNPAEPFYDSLQMNQPRNYGSATDARLSSNLTEGFVVGQQKLQSRFMAAEAGSLDDIVNSTMKQVCDLKYEWANGNSERDLLGTRQGFGN